MASSSSPSPSFTAEPAEYDVFLSFRGEDTRDKFTSHLYDALCKKQIRPFIDPQVVDSRDEMAPSLLKTIEGSKISVVIFSEGYASSTWCLDELVKILECRKLNGQIVLPVFYHVSPNDVRRQRGNFGNRFLELEKRFKDMPEKVQLWRAALTDAGNLPGWDSALIRPVSMLVEEIVKYVLKKLEDILFSSYVKYARISSVPAGHLTWWPEFHSQAPFKSEFVPSLGDKDEMTSNLSGVVSEIVPASDTEPMSDMDEDPVLGPKNLTEDEMTLPPQTEELATHVPGNTTTISDGEGRMQPIDVKFGCGLFQNKGDQANRMLKSMKRNVQKIVRYVNDVTVSTVALTMKRNVQKIVRYVNPHRGRKDEMTSNLSGHFVVVSEIVPASDTEPMSDLDEPMSPSCSNLLILSLQGNFQLRDIPPSFFDSMNSLKFLNLSNTRIKSLPNTISKLRELQILILRDCERLSMLPSEIGSLVSLEVLDLRGTEIYKLPDEIVNLASLRYLEVFFYGSIDDREYASLPCNLISRDTISRLQALESLSIVVFPGDERWYRDVEYLISEVSSLTKLSSLRFHFPQSHHVKEFLEKSMAWRDRRLTKFNFVVGYDVKRIISRVPESVEFDYNQHDKCLRNVNGKEICPTTIQILARSDAFYLDHHLDIESLSDFGISNIKGLKFCIISECPRIKTVVNNKDHTAAVFPSLENLNVNLLWNLTCIWEGIVPRGSLGELRILSVRTCPKLEFILTRSMIGFLTKLEELTVEDCRAVGSILLEDEIIGSNSVMLPSLKRLRLHDLPELVNIWENVGSSVEHISIFNCPKLKKMGMESSSKLKDTLIEIEAEKWWWDELQWDDIDMPSNLEDRLTIIS